MNFGVYCRPKSSNNVYDAIIIDRFNKICAHNEESKNTEKKDCKMESLETEDSSSYSTNSCDEEKWQCGTNVRAPFADDGELYEAIIERIFDDSAIVRYLGYENEEAIKLKDLRPSLGKKSIAKQINLVNEYDDEEEEEGYNEIEPTSNQWKVGMRCRALYEPNEIVYEAVIQEIDPKNCKAVVVMSGYGIPFEASFDNIHESIPELRVKQERNAKAHLASKDSAVEEVDSSTVPNPFTSSVPNIYVKSSLPGVSCNFSNYQSMMQPENENEALACLVSSNYLSGYYAGYYDCMKKFQNLKKN